MQENWVRKDPCGSRPSLMFVTLSFSPRKAPAVLSKIDVIYHTLSPFGPGGPSIPGYP